MNRFLQLLGVDTDILRHLDRAQLVVEHPIWLAVGLALLVPAAVFIYRRQQHNLAAVPGWLTVALSVTRVVVLLLLLLALVGPAVKLDFQTEQKPIVAVLIDRSDSMNLPAGPFDKDAELTAVAKAAGYAQTDAATRKALNRISRLNLAESVLRSQSNDWIKPLAARFEVREYAFAAELTPRLDSFHETSRGLRKSPSPRPSPAGGRGSPDIRSRSPQILPLPAAGEAGPAAERERVRERSHVRSDALSETRSRSASLLGDALLKIIDDAGSRRLAGIVVLADGQNSGGTPLAAVAERATALGVPLFTVPVGSASELPDVSVVDVTTAGQISLGDSARVTVTLESHGLAGKTTKVELLDGETVLDARDVTLRALEQQQVELTFETKRAGSRHLVVSVAPLAEESEVLRANNEATTVCRVSPEKIRVLYLEGLPRWDFRFLKNAMRRDHGIGGARAAAPDIVLETEWRRRPTEQAAQLLPQTVEDLAAYHTVVLGDASPRLVSPEFRKALVEAVRDRGVGLVIAAGPLFMPHGYDELLTDLLPVRLTPRVAGVDAPSYRPFKIELTPEGTLHEVMRLDDDADRNRLIWGQMPGFYWCAAAERAAAGATVLAWNTEVAGKQGAVPLVAYQYVGKGKMLFLGLDSTWRWRGMFADRYFYRFWGQSLRFVARGDVANRRSQLAVRPAQITPGEPMEIELQAFAPDGTPRKESTLTVSVITAGQTAQPIELAADGGRSGKYVGQFVPPTVGRYRVTFSSDDESAPVDVTVPVLDVNEELRFPRVDRAALEKLALASGGKLVELPALASIPAQLQGEPKLVAIRRVASLWDNWLMALLLVSVYSLDVGLRRLRGLA